MSEVNKCDLKKMEINKDIKYKYDKKNIHD
jgi:hypothetical protein